MNIGQVKYSYIYLIKPRWFLFSHQVRCWSRMSEIYTGNRFKYLLDISTNIDVVSWQWGVRVYRFDHQRSLHRMHWCFLTALGKAVSWINDLVFINKMFVIDQVLSSALRTVCKDEFLIFLSDFCHYFRLLGNKNVKKIFSDIPQCLSPRYSLSQFYSKNSSHYHVSWRGARGRRQYTKVGEEGGGVNFLVAAFLHFSILFKTKYLSLFPWKSDASES